MSKKFYVYNMNGVAIISEQDDLKFPKLGEADTQWEAEKICDDFVLPKEEKQC
jgi:hypothetical protein